MGRLSTDGGAASSVIEPQGRLSGMAGYDILALDERARPLGEGVSTWLRGPVIPGAFHCADPNLRWKLSRLLGGVGKGAHCMENDI
jgi:hypothetical protein